MNSLNMSDSNHETYLKKPEIGRTLEELSILAPQKSKLYVKNSFEHFFFKKGYNYKKPMGLIPKDHKSILYTNSAILNLLTQIRNEKYDGKFYTIQPCLRTQNLGGDNDKVPDYMSSFTMPGVFSTIDDYPVICGDIISFFKGLLGGEALSIAYDPSHKIHQSYREHQDIQYTKHPHEYYNWSFGNTTIRGDLDLFSTNFSGEGASILLKNNEKYEEIGNIIILKQNNQPTHVGFGFGIETTLSILNYKEVHQVFFGNIDPKIFSHFNGQLNDSYTIRIIDNIQIIFDLINNDIKPSNRGRGYIMVKALKKINELAININLSIEKIDKLFDLHNQNEILKKYFRYYNKKQ